MKTKEEKGMEKLRIPPFGSVKVEGKVKKRKTGRDELLKKRFCRNMERNGRKHEAKLLNFLRMPNLSKKFERTKY